MNDSAIEQETSLSRVELVYRKLRDNIITNQFPPGYQALEPEIAKQLGVSRTPVREALIRLEAENLIQLVPRRGMRVLPLVPDDIKEINEILTGLEVMAVELLAKQKPGRDLLEPMESALDEMDKSLLTGDMELWAEADEKFHRFLLALAGNQRLASMAESVRIQSQRSRKITLKLRPSPESTNSAYRKLLNAIAAGNWQEAKEVHYQHRLEVSQMLVDLLEKYQLPHL